ACDAYPDCENTYPLPQYGAIKNHDDECKKCGGPQIVLVMNRRKPQEMCLFIDCDANKERRKKYEDSKKAKK
ncbi:MAG: hypothetical protein KAJ33_06915, partial [Thermoplasmata archaeon]|nr:hypothetical protein [Thermoplasmata archaeon]